MRVIRVRAWLWRVLCAWIVLIVSLVSLVMITPDLPRPRSPRRHLPAAYWEHREDYPSRYVRSGCVSPPNFREVQYGDVAFWQRVTSEHESTVLVFAAYWDARDEPRIRLLVHSEHELEDLMCLLWYYNIGDPVLVDASVSVPSGTAEEPAALQVVSCAPPSTPAHHTLAAVSVVTGDYSCGTPRNILAIQGVPKTADEKPLAVRDPRQLGLQFGVCLLWWRQGDAATRLAEWLQLLKYFGVHRVYIYINHRAHENVLRVIDFFSWRANDTMKVDVMPYVSPPLTFSGSGSKGASNRTSSKPKEINEQGDDFDEYSVDYKEATVTNRKEEAAPVMRADDLLPYNECVYRALGERVDWLALLDIDEILVPVQHGTWEMLAYQESKKAKYESDELPDVLHFERWWYPEWLQNLTTPAPVTIATTKSFAHEHAVGIRRRSTAAPPAVPPGRIFEYKYRAPTARTDVVPTSKLLRTASVVHVRQRGVTCLDDCHVRTVHSKIARVHLYTSRCGGATRGVCRALRRASVLTDCMWKWRRAQQEAHIALRRSRVAEHARSYLDDE